MHAARPPTIYTDTRQLAWMLLPSSAIVIALGARALSEGEKGFAAFFLALGVWAAVMCICQFASNGKQASMTVGDEGVSFADGTIVAFRDVENITVMEQFGQMPVQCLSIIFDVGPEVPVKQGGRSVRRSFMLSHVYGNISFVGKRRMFCFMTPGLRIMGGKRQNDDDVSAELFGRFEAFQQR
ncbi:hypothetical protein [Massilia genomosp. 1]|uniref:Uncharacterized protein n=1 Tax=Massilia genomosp. 1 TaxID=2609280 RepID=A0ABX0MZJ2_9BURK|nr:hypothetical protein [Massilia genomosp. 1]NHZ65661.1 hypothetical protein [Massilia genomosp. 1]